MKKIYEDIRKVFESKISSHVLTILGIIIIILAVFSAGMAIGFKKASFGRNWGENYEKNFGMRSKGPMFDDRDFPVAHGAVGKIIKIELPTIIVQDKDNTEKIVLVNEQTQIQKMRDSIKKEELKLDDFIIVIGNPNEQGQIDSKLIRLMPSPELMPGFKKF